jgi:hypothetical protein
MVHRIEGFGKIHNGYICLFTTCHAIKNFPEGTSKLLKNLNPTKAIGPDKISPHFLKEVHDEISPMI